MAPKPKLWDSVKVAKKFQKLKHLEGREILTLKYNVEDLFLSQLFVTLFYTHQIGFFYLWRLKT